MFKLPGKEEKAAYVENMFNSIASTYDVLNTLMTFGLDRLWRRFAVKRAGLSPGGKGLDVCCGTGMLTQELARAAGPNGLVTGLDFSEKMLVVAAKNRARFKYGDRITFIQGNALDLPFPNDSFDCITVGFGLRNVPDLGRALAEMSRVVKPGGKIVSLDMGKPAMPVFRQIYWFCFAKLVPLLGKVWAGKKSPYSYLYKSAVEFPAQEELVGLFTAAGLQETTFHNLWGGVVAVVEGKK